MFRGCVCILLLLPAAAQSAAALEYEWRGPALDTWQVVHGEDGTQRTVVTDPSVPPGHGPEVLHLRSEHFAALAPVPPLEAATVVALYRELDPQDADADGILVFGAQAHSPEHWWMEIDNDTGLHLVHLNADRRERSFALVPGLGLITDPWNRTGWIWQKLQYDATQVRAKYWGAEIPEPAAWQLESPWTPPAAPGRPGVRIGSGAIHLAYFAYDTADILPPAPQLYLYPRQPVITRLEDARFTIFSNLDEAVLQPVFGGGAGRFLQLELQVLTADRAPAYGGTVFLPAGHSAKELAFIVRTQILVDEHARFAEAAGPRLIPVPGDMPHGPLGVALASARETVLGETQVQYVDVSEHRDRVQALREEIAAVEHALHDPDAAQARVVLDAARAHLGQAEDALVHAQLALFERSLTFAQQALEEFGGYKRVLMESAGADPAMAPKAPAEGQTWAWSPAFMLRPALAPPAPGSFIMGREYVVQVQGHVVGTPPDTPVLAELRVVSPLGQRVVARDTATVTAPGAATFRLKITAEDAEPRPSEPLVLDEYHNLVLRLQDTDSGVPYIADTPAPELGPPMHPLDVPGQTVSLGAVYVSSTPLELDLRPGDQRQALEMVQDVVVVRNAGDRPQTCTLLLSARDAFQQLQHQAAWPVAIAPGEEAVFASTWRPTVAGPLTLHAELLQEQQVHTETQRRLHVRTPGDVPVTINRANTVRAASGLDYTLAISATAGTAADFHLRVHTPQGSTHASQVSVSSAAVEAPPGWGFHHAELDFGGWRYRELVPATVAETCGTDLLVNGEPFLIKGVNVHGLNAHSRENTRSQMRILRELGFNLLRGDYPPRWQLDMALEEGLGWTVLAPFSVIHTRELFPRLGDQPLNLARAVSHAFLDRYVDAPATLLWNSCNEVEGEIDAFLLAIHPVYRNLDPYQRPVHFANLFGQDRFLGQDAVGINYYFNDGEQPTARQPMIARNLATAKAIGLPLFYTEYNSFQGAIPTTGAAAIEHQFHWGVERGMAGGFYYFRFNSDRHPGVYDGQFNVNERVAAAFRAAYADATVELVTRDHAAARVRIGNRRGFSLRDLTLLLHRHSGEHAVALHDLGPHESIEVELPADGAPEIAGDLRFTTHYAFSERVPFRLVSTASSSRIAQ